MKYNKKSKNLILIMIFLVFFFSSGNLIPSKLHVKKIDLTLSNKVGEGVLNYPGLPVMGYNISAIDDEYFYVYDSKGQVPFYALEKASLKLKNFGAWGQGPGELEPGFPLILGTTKSNLFVYLPLQMRILIFQKNLKFLKEIRAEKFEIGSAFYMIGDTEGIYISSFSKQDSLSFAEGYRIEQSGKISSTSLYYGEYKKLSEIAALKNNPMLKKGPIHVDREGNIYFAHYYSSLRMGFFPKGGTIFVDFGPRNIEIPKAEIRKIEGGIITGDPEKSTQCYLALSSDDKYLYALFSGEEISMEKIIAYRTGKSKELNLGEGKIVDVFNKKDGSYLFSFELPVYATSIAVDRNHLYITTIEDNPCILIFNLNSAGFRE